MDALAERKAAIVFEKFVEVCDRFVSILERVEKIVVKKLEEEEASKR